MQKIALFVIFTTAFAITANLHIYVQTQRLGGIYAFHVFLPVIPVQFFLALALGHLFKLDRVTRLYLLWWTFFFLVIAMSIIFVDGGTNALAEAQRYSIVAAISLSFLTVVQNRSLAIAAAYGIACSTLLAAGISFAEFLNPDFTMIVDQRYEHDKIKEGVVGRIGGLYVNPNANARLMALGMFVSCFFLPQKYRLIFCAFVGCAVFTTVSRSGIVTWAFAMVMLTALGQLAPGKIVTKAIGLSAVAILAVLLSTGALPKLLESAGLDEFMSPKMTERLSSNFFTQEDGSTSSRKDLAVYAIDMFADNPILGAGLGQSTDLGEIGLGSHNTMLQIASETGTLGLVVYLCLFLIPLSQKSVKGTAFMLLYTLSSMFGHGLMHLPALAFILPAGIVLLCKLDQRVSKSSGRRRRRKMIRPAHARSALTT
jgi:hypothetical protein